VVLLVVMGLTESTVVMTVLLFVAGILAILFMTTANTRLQTLAPDHLRGRVMGIYILLFIGTIPIGSYLIGALAEYLPMDAVWRVRATMFIMAGLSAVGVTAGAVYALRSRGGIGGEAEQDPALSDEAPAWNPRPGDALENGPEAA
jgi:MFS family permease